MKRRQFLTRLTSTAAGAFATSQLAALAQNQVNSGTSSGDAIQIDPQPLFEISPHLYMQFMEPLGVTDSSVEASWDYNQDDWRKDFVETTKDLAPGMMRFGGLLSRYYKWHEGVGPVAKRPPYRNYVWGGWETHRVGTHEFVDFCRRVNSEPMYCVNFAGDGFERFKNTPQGDRTGDAKEAADWVSYANDPSHAERKANGATQPFNLKYWQLGNETSYGKGGFSKDDSIATTIRFAKAMRERDPSLKLIGWGDNGWAGDLIDRAGEHIDYVAVHMMGQTPIGRDSVLVGNRYQNEPERAWNELMNLIATRIETKLVSLEESMAKQNSKHGIAITEGHLSLQPHNANPILTEWLTGVYHARVMNLYQRHGNTVKISTAADFNGNRWTTNALIHQVPGNNSYLLPVGAAMRLFKKHNGSHGITVKSAPDSLDIAASRRDNKIFLHVANMSFSTATSASFAVDGMTLSGGHVVEISPENPRQEISSVHLDAFKPREHTLDANTKFNWRFPARSVSVVELDCVS